MGKNGDCFDKHGRKFLFENPGDNWKIVHGIVINSKDKKPMEHCWLEKTEDVEMPDGRAWPTTTCVDQSNGHDVEIVAEIYYYSGRVQEMKKYDLESYRKFIHDTGHWGPWEIDDGREH